MVRHYLQRKRGKVYFFTRPKGVGVNDALCLPYYEWTLQKAYHTPVDKYIDGGAVVTALCNHLMRYSVPQGFTTFDNDTFWYANIEGKLCGITLSKYTEYWQAQIIDVIFPLIR